MSGKSRTRQRQGQAPGQRPSRPAGQGNGPPAAQRQATSAAQRKPALAHERKAKVAAAKQAQRRAGRRRTIGVRAAIAAGVAAAAAGLFVIFSSSNASHPGAGAYPYQVASPGQGSAAPGFTLAASTGGKISLSQYRGKSVLLFFQEGLTCQPAGIRSPTCKGTPPSCARPASPAWSRSPATRSARSPRRPMTCT